MTLLHTLQQQDVLNRFDAVLGNFLGRFDARDEVRLAVALTRHAVANGHVCLYLPDYAERALVPPDAPSLCVTPDVATWQAILADSPIVGQPGEFKPLILDNLRLYLYRYWQYEQQLAEDLRIRAAMSVPVDEAWLTDRLAALFPARPDGLTDWQKVAAAVAVLRRLTLISGAPGTGKTTTLARILVLLIEQRLQPHQPPLHIGLAAPTGKAAARMQEALRSAQRALAAVVDPLVLDALPTEAATLHRLLGASAESTQVRYHRERPLPLDVLVIDETSMVDLPLMAKTVAALRPTARLILLGDAQQLSSVEAGTVLADLCSDSEGYTKSFSQKLQRLTGATLSSSSAVSVLQNNVVWLQHSYRFSATSGIGQLAKAIQQGHADRVETLLTDPAQTDLHWHRPPDAPNALPTLLTQMSRGYRTYLNGVQQRLPVPVLFQLFNQFQLLSTHRSGLVGVHHLNQAFEDHQRLRRSGRDWYAGRPVMITHNDYTLRLFNGDVGLTLPATDGTDILRVFFLTLDGGVRSFPISRLPAHETVFAMTVHKSQGSEFSEVFLVLPQEAERTVTLSRELLYTGITRAKQTVHIWGDRDTLRRAVSHPLQRTSGLAHRLRLTAS